MKRFFFSSVCLLVALLAANMAWAQKFQSMTDLPARYSQASLSQSTTNRTLINIGQVAMWIYSDGLSARTPSGNAGMFFPRGSDPATAVMFQDQLVWGGQVLDGAEPVIRVGGGQYAVGHVAGKILAPGVAEDPTDPNVDRVWRIRRDFHNAALTLDAAEFNDIQPGQVTSAQIAQVRDIYRQDWLDWPADKGAPFYDADGDGSYNPVLNADGSPRLAPRADESFDPTRHADEPGLADADQVAWLVTNDLDALSLASFSGSPPIGIEQQITLWAYAGNDERSHVVFKRFRLIYKGTSTTPATARIDSIYFSQWSDPDVGALADDLAGCDIPLDFGFAYNSSSTDAIYSAAGLPPPATGFDLLAGPEVPDESSSGVFDLKLISGIRNLDMTSFIIFFSGSPQSDPTIGTYNATLQWWNIMRGFFPRPENQRTPIIDPTTGLPTKFMVPGDPVTGFGWLDSGPGDRRMVMSSGPATMALGDTQDVVVASVAGIGTDRLSSVAVAKLVDRKASDFFDDLTKGRVEPPTLALQASGLDHTVVLRWPDVRAGVDNKQGFLFEGYNIYQGDTPNGPWHRVVTFDEVNDVEVIFDEVFDANTGTVINMPVQFGRDSGVQHFAEISDDVIHGGLLTNGRELYYGVSAYLYRAEGEPSALESAISAASVTPVGPVIGTDYSDVTADSMAEHVAGVSDGLVRVSIIDPSLVTGHTYEITFEKDDATDELLWSLRNTNTGELKLFDQAQLHDSSDISGSTVDGLLVQVLTPVTGFKSFEIVQYAGLPMTPASAAFNFQQFPTPLDENPFETPGGGKWAFHTFGFRTTFASFLERVLRGGRLNDELAPSDYELRFTAAGGFANWRFEDQITRPVPFEIWNIGVNTPDNATDDYRMIPWVISNDVLGNPSLDRFGFQLDPVDHMASGGDNDPTTGGIYWSKPADRTAGTAGYDAFVAEGTDGVTPTAGGEGSVEALARIVLINWNAGDVNDPTFPANIAEPLPPDGTTFRLVTTKPNTESDVFRFTTESFMMFDITKGDINDDGSVDVADVVLLIDFILQTRLPTGEQQYAADFNEDLGVNVADVVAIVNQIIGIPEGEPTPAAPAQVNVNLAEQALLENGIVSVSLQVGSGVPVHGLQLELEYDSSRLRPLPLSLDGLGDGAHHARDGKVSYLFSSLEHVPVSLSGVPALRFELLNASEKSEAPEISLVAALSADSRGYLQKTTIGNATASTRFVPTRFALHQNFPNPFNPETTLRFDLPENSKVDIAVYNILGQKVRRLLRVKDFAPGQHSVRWDGRDDSGRQLATGVYVVRLTTAGFAKSRKIMLLK